MFKEGELYQEELIQFGSLMAINEKLRLTGRDLGLTNRQISNWNKEGMFIEPIIEGKRKEFDFVESLWISLAIELQNYGFSFEEIKEYKKVLCHSDMLEWVDLIDSGELSRDHPNLAGIGRFEIEGKKLDIDAFFKPENLKPYRELKQNNPHVLLNLFSHVFVALIRKGNYRFAFAHGGLMHFDWDITVDKSIDSENTETITSKKQILNHIMESSGVVISLDYLISSIIVTEPQYKKNPRPINLLLSKAEREIIEQLREFDNCDSIEIRMENEAPISMVVSASMPYVDLETRIATLIRKNSFGEVNMKFQDGKIQVVMQKTRFRLNNQSATKPD